VSPASTARNAFVDSYTFMDVLSRHTKSTDTIVTGNGLDAVCAYQAYRVSAGQRLLMTGWGSMGWDLPLAIGACIGNRNERVVLITGDGSIMWNIAELQMIHCYELPIKIFIFNNNGYSSIRATQDNFFHSRYVGADPESGVMNPNFKLLAAAFNIAYTHKLDGHCDVADCISSFLNDDRPAICEVMISPQQTVEPKASAFRRPDGSFESRPLEDMAPFLPRAEVAVNMNRFDVAVRQH
jgi:acetolactate synthase-1/2/3 large subunit